jgi:filamentous hemagglutinin family protein
MTIGAELGATRGVNLFHSFQRFDIPTGQRATFTGPDQIQNVIGRVTGGQTSRIDGTLRSTVGQADVYLINPAGVVLGPNAKVDVPAAFHLSTADELRFSDGSRYSARDPSNSTLTLASPESFGFLSAQPASLSIEGSQLELKSGQTATLTAGDVRIAGTAEQHATLMAPGGEIRIEATGDEPAVLPVTTPSQTPVRGRLAVAQTDLNTSGDGGGRIAIRAGALDLKATTIIADNRGAVDATGGLDLQVAGTMRLDDSWLFANTTARGQGGVVRVQSGELWMNTSSITSNSYRSNAVSADESIGAAGGVWIEVAGILDVLNGAYISSSTSSDGSAGNVSVQAGNVRLDSQGFTNWGTVIASESYRNASGGAGDVMLKVDGLLEVLNGAYISSSTYTSGDAGTVSVQAGSARLDSEAAIVSEAYRNSSGDAGDVTLKIDGLLEMLNGAYISSSTYAAGDAGTVSVMAGNTRLDSQGFTAWGTGIRSDSFSTGDAGGVMLTVDGLLEVLNGAYISSDTWAAGSAGTVDIQVGSVRLDGQGFTAGATGILSQSSRNSTGDAGDVTLTVAGLLEVLNGAMILSGTRGTGDAGVVRIEAGSVRLDSQGFDPWITGIISGTGDSRSTGDGGDAGSVLLTVEGLLEVLSGASISSSTYTSGDAGTVSVQSGSAHLDSEAAIISQAYRNSSGDAGDVTLKIDGLLEMLNGAYISSSTYAAGDAGTVSVMAGSTRLDSQGFTAWGTGIRSDSFSTGDAGGVMLAIDGLLEVLNGAYISSDTWAAGNAGTVDILAGSARLDDQGFTAGATGILSQSSRNSTGDAGDVTLTVAGLLEVLNGAMILSGTRGTGDAGVVRIEAGSVRLDSQGTGIISGTGDSRSTGDGGDAGGVLVTVEGLLEVLNGASISSSTYTSGDAGKVSVQAGSARLDSEASILSEADHNSSGTAGDVTLRVDGQLEVLNGASISSSTWAAGDAGRVIVEAGSVRLDSQGCTACETGIASAAARDSTGAAGDVTLIVDGLLEVLNGAYISSDTLASGKAGTINVQAGSLRLDGHGAESYGSMIVSQANKNSTGAAGDVKLRVDGLLEILNGAYISSSTYTSGDAGTVSVQSESARIDSLGFATWGTGIYSISASTGNTGDISLTVDRWLEVLNGAAIAISTAAQVLDPDAMTKDLQHFIQLKVEHLTLSGGGITAQSTGNVPAAAIDIQAQDLRLTQGSRITTESKAANAGPITISGGSLWLTDSLITTSANGTTGDGGNISLSSETLILDGGFIQANTSAPGAHGGNILIDTRALIAGEGRLEIGSATRQTFITGSGHNIIQAAAEGGEQGTIAVTALDLDITAALVPLTTPFEDPDALLFDACRPVGGSQSSSLVERGWGGIPASPSAPATVSFDDRRLDRLLSP